MDTKSIEKTKTKMTKDNEKIIYLAGPMEYAENSGLPWRLEYKDRLFFLGYDCIVPHHEEGIIATQEELNWCKENDPAKYISIMREIIDLDLSLIDQSDFIVAKWDGEIISGTTHEIGYAYEKGIPSYLVTSKSFKEIPGWFAACFTKIFNDKISLFNYLVEHNK